MLTQEMLNVETRNEGYIDILMFVPDKNIRITNTQANSTLSFSNLLSIIDLDRYSSNAMATLEKGLWILDGTFFNANQGQKYDGYISDNMSDDDGNFETNPKITIDLLQSSKIEYVSMVFNASVASAYPKQTVLRLKGSDGNSIREISQDMTEVDTMPNFIIDVNQENVKSVEVEFIGTQVPHRRIRLSTFMFGKLEMFTQDNIKESHWSDKSSLVADSLASRTFNFTLFNYDKRYNLDNPASDLPVLDRNTEVMIRWGYNNDGLIEWTEMKHFRLTSVLSNEDNTVTLECGSILDMMDQVYDQDVYSGPRTVREVVNRLLTFSGVSTDTVIYDGDYGDAIIDRPLPEQAVRELIQLCAFACGATLQILDNGKIRFANLNLSNVKTSFNYNDFTSVPRAEQLEHTYDIALTKNTSEVEKEESQLTTQTITTFKTSISYSAAMSPYVKRVTGGTLTNAKYYATHCELEVNFTGDSCEVEIWGYKITTTTNYKKSATSSTLILDSKLAANPSDETESKYSDWYSKKFKYVMDTRGEPLVNATDVVDIQSPFTEKTQESVRGYVLQNEMDYNGAWSGRMEVIAL